MQEKKPFDFASYRLTQEGQEAGKEFEIVDDAGARTGVFFFLHGMASSRYRTGQSELRAKRMREQRIGEPDYEQDAADMALALSWCVGGWRTGDEKVVYLDGEALPFSRENAERVLLLSDFLRGQIRVRVESAAGFINA
jgi:hypothetical protein